MKLIACSIRDVVVGSFNRPYMVVSKGQAIRAFTDEVNRPSEENPMYKHPGDYDLYVVGDFDEETGQLTGLAAPELLLNGASVRV